jgi:integrase
MELCQLDVSDLRAKLDGALALNVREGKGAKARLVPYGDLDWCLLYVDKWRERAGINAGALFRAFVKGGKRVRLSRLSVRAVPDIIDRYPIVVDGKMLRVNPHDLRRTYARRWYDAGTLILAIQQNLGHADHKTTAGYIGTLDAGASKPSRLFKPPHFRELDTLA